MKNKMFFAILLFGFKITYAAELISQKTLEMEHYTFFNSKSGNYNISVNRDISVPCSYEISYQITKINPNKVFIERTEVDLRNGSDQLKCKDPGIIIPMSNEENSHYSTVIFYKGSGIKSVEIVE